MAGGATVLKEMRMQSKALAIAAVAALAVVAVHGQAAQTGVKPASAGPDVKGILYEAANSLGMLRSIQERESIATQEYWATGNMSAGGQTAKIGAYRISLDYPSQAMRVDFTRTGADGKPQRDIQVVAGNFAWNETEPGKGGPPAPAAVRERLLQLWSWPIGVVKAATLAGANAKVSMEGGFLMLTFPLPAPLADVTMKATLDRNNKHFVLWSQEPEAKARLAKRVLPLYRHKPDLVGLYIVRVEARFGNAVTDITYGEYGDWNPDDNKADIMTPRRVARKDGNTTWDLRITATNTYNPYVLMRVPANVRTAN